jgi:hypothetical protein
LRQCSTISLDGLVSSRIWLMGGFNRWFTRHSRMNLWKDFVLLLWYTLFSHAKIKKRYFRRTYFVSLLILGTFLWINRLTCDFTQNTTFSIHR